MSLNGRLLLACQWGGEDVKEIISDGSTPTGMALAAPTSPPTGQALGAKVLELEANSSNEYFEAGTEYTAGALGFSVRPVTNPGAGADGMVLMGIDNGALIGCYVSWHNSTNSLQVRGWDGSDIITSTSIVIDTSTNLDWYWVELYWRLLASGRTAVKLRVYKCASGAWSLHGEAEAIADATMTIDGVRYGSLGLPTQATTGKVQVGNVLLLGGGGVDLPKAPSMVTIFPNGTGLNHANWKSSATGADDAANEWNLVEEKPPNTADYVFKVGTAQSHQYYTLDDVTLSGANVLGACARAYAAQSAAGTSSLALALRVGTGASSQGTFLATTTSYKYHTIHCIQADPADGSDLVEADIDSLQVAHPAVSVTIETRVAQIFVTVAYGANSTAPAAEAGQTQVV